MDIFYFYTQFNGDNEVSQKKGTRMSITVMVYGFVAVSIALVTGIEYYTSITYDDEY